ncbi:MAG: Uma2 family endonuclease [Anaerolineae bacterium]|nr:Uma2 family endonuclease [Anaerolineae bacterium]
MAMEPVKRKWTVEEYLVYEQETGIKHEYIDGDIYAMSGGSGDHALIMMNCGIEIGSQLRGSSCRAYSSELKVKISETKFVYPDLSVVCGEAKYADEQRNILTNPTLVVEVISPTSASYDRGDKLDYYQSVPSIMTYLILEQEAAKAHLYTREGEKWLFQSFFGLEAVIPLEAINCRLSLDEVYRGVDFQLS